MQTVYIMQGAPGSGKSRVARIIRGWDGYNDRPTDRVIVSADQYPEFWESGNYVFKPEAIGDAHKWCQEECRHHLALGDSVLIDNTNIRQWEARPYVEMAQAVGALVVFVRCTGTFPNVHGVPEEKVLRMRARLEELTVEGCLAAVDKSDKGG